MDNQILESLLEDYHDKATETNQLLEALVEQNSDKGNTENLLEAQIELLDDIKTKLTTPSLEVKGEEIKIDMSKIESSIDKLVEKVNEPIKITLSLE